MSPHRRRETKSLTKTRYEMMPNDRPHPCHEKNAAGIEVAWIILDPHYDGSYELYTTDAYGDGSIVRIAYCPWCGVKL